MKNIKTLFVTIMVLTLLTSCGGGGTKPPESINFFAVESTVNYDSSNKSADVQLDWTPNDHVLEFSDFKFTYNDQVTSAEQTGDLTARPATVTISFATGLASTVTGTLSFHYVDKTAKNESDGEIVGININVDIPPTPVIDDGGIDITYMRVRAYRNVQIKFSYTEGPKSTGLEVHWGDGRVDNLSEHTYINGGTYHVYIIGDIDNISLTDENGNLLANGNGFVTNTIFSNHVTTIASKAFAIGGELTSVFIPKTVTTIGAGAFNAESAKYYCVNNIWGNEWYNSSSSETEVIVGLNIYLDEANILYAAYDGENQNKFAAVYLCCDLQLKNAIIPSEIEIQKEDEKVVYAVTSIWESAFYNMVSLESVTFPNTITEIGECAFIDCQYLKETNIGELTNLTTIASKAFARTGLVSLTIPNSVKTLGNSAFGVCSNLKYVTFMDNSPITSLSSNVFIDCENIVKFNLAEGLECINTYLLEEMAIGSLALPLTLKKLCSYCIRNCKNFEVIDATKFTYGYIIPDADLYALSFANPGKTITIKMAPGLTVDDFVKKGWPNECGPGTTSSGFKYVEIAN